MLDQTWGERGREREREEERASENVEEKKEKERGRDGRKREESGKNVANYQGNLAVDAGTYFSTLPSFRCSKMS